MCRWGQGKVKSLVQGHTRERTVAIGPYPAFLPWPKTPCTNAVTGEAVRVWLQWPKLVYGKPDHCLVIWAVGPGFPQLQSLGTFPQLCPHCLPETICGTSLVGVLARLDGSRGNILLVPTSWPRHHRSCLASPGPDQLLLPCSTSH